MRIAICTLHRDSGDLVEKAFAERERWQFPAADLVHVCVEGDSVDDTFARLTALSSRHRIVLEKLDSGRPRYPSVIDPDRLALLADAWNRALELAVAEQVDRILILDNDLSTPSDLLPRLLARNVKAVAPMLYLEGSNRFRDTWAYRANNDTFRERYPYSPAFQHGRLFEVESVGVPFVDAQLVRDGARFSREEEVVGFCRSIRRLGHKIFVDSTVAVYHPPIQWPLPA